MCPANHVTEANCRIRPATCVLRSVWNRRNSAFTLNSCPASIASPRLRLAHPGARPQLVEAVGGGLDDYTRCLKLNPREPTVWFKRGEAYAEMRSRGHAQGDSSEAAMLKPALRLPARYK